MSDVHLHFHGVEEEEIVCGYFPDRIGSKWIHALGVTVGTEHHSLAMARSKGGVRCVEEREGVREGSRKRGEGVGKELGL